MVVIQVLVNNNGHNKTSVLQSNRLPSE